MRCDLCKARGWRINFGKWNGKILLKGFTEPPSQCFLVLEIWLAKASCVTWPLYLAISLRKRRWHLVKTVMSAWVCSGFVLKVFPILLCLSHLTSHQCLENYGLISAELYWCSWNISRSTFSAQKSLMLWQPLEMFGFSAAEGCPICREPIFAGIGL